MTDLAVHLRRGPTRAALVERLGGGVGAYAGVLGEDLAKPLASGVGRLAQRRHSLPLDLGGERLRPVRIAELDAAGLSGSQCGLGALADLGALLLGDDLFMLHIYAAGASFFGTANPLLSLPPRNEMT